MTDPDDSPAVTLRRDGSVTGLALLGQAGGEGREFVAVLRTPTGVLEGRAGTIATGGHPTVGSVAEAEASPVAFEAVMALVAPGRHPNRKAKDAVASVALANGMSVADLTTAVGPRVAEFAEALPARLVRLFRCPVAGLPLDQRTWRVVEGPDGTGDTPLARCLDERPLLSRLVMQSHRVRPLDFDRAVSAKGGLDALLGEQATRWKAVPGRHLGTLADAERVLSGWSREGLDRLRKVVPRIRGNDDIPVRFALLLAHVPTAWHPRGDAAWEAFVDMLPILEAALDVTEPAGDPARAGRTMVAMLGAGRGWVDLRRRVSAASGGLHPVDALNDLDDVQSAFEMQVVTPALALAGLNPEAEFLTQDMAAQRVAAAILLSGRDVVGAFALSTSWHRRRPGMEAVMDGLPGRVRRDVSWGAGLPDAEVGGFRIRALTSSVDLRMEGRSGPDVAGMDGMGNCVAQYVGDCLGGKCRILSLTRVGGDGKARRVSTAEIRFLGDGDLVVRQHRGPRDAPVPDDAREALWDYIGDVIDGRLRIDRDALEPLPAEPGGTNLLERDCGYEWRVPGNWERAFATWGPFLRRGVRSMDATTFAAFARSLDTGVLSDWARSPWLTDALPVPGGTRADVTGIGRAA